MDKNKNKKANTAVVVHGNTLPEQAPDYLALAVTSGAGIDVIERLVGLKERVDKAAAESAFNLAMAAFQKKCPIIKKTKGVKEKNSAANRYKYAPIDDIISQVKDLIAEQGLFYTFTPNDTADFISVTCHVTHSAGHSKSSTFKVPIGKEEYMSESQKYGGRNTFAKRYAFCNAFGIITGDGDTDANEPEAKDEKKKGEGLTDTMQKAIEFCKNDDEIMVLWNSNALLQKKKWFIDAIAAHVNTFPLPDNVAHEIATAGEEELTVIFNSYKNLQKRHKFINAMTNRRNELGGNTKAPILP